MTKKLLLFLAIFASNLSSFPLEASLVGNPADPSSLDEGFWISDRCWSSLRLGVTGDFLLEKKMRTCRVSHHLGISNPEMDWKLAICDLGWNIKERFEFHLLLGPVSSTNFSWQQSQIFYKASGDRGFFWGASSKLILLEMMDTTFGIDFHGGGVQSIKGPFLVNGAPEKEPFSSRLYFWQIAAGFSQNLGPLKPYIGAVTSHLVYVLNPPTGRNLRFHDLLAAGAYEGCTLSFGSRISLNIEARQFFESGISFSGELRF